MSDLIRWIIFLAGTIELLARSLRLGGIILISEPYWWQYPPTEEVGKGCLAESISEFLILPELLASFGPLGYEVDEMILADQDGWDRYEAGHGPTLFAGLSKSIDLKLVSWLEFGSGAVALKYEPRR